MDNEEVSVAVVGATGYAGAELIRLLLAHPRARIAMVCGQSKAGVPIAEALPSLRGVMSGEVEQFDAGAVRDRADAAFCALPHGASAPIVGALRDRGVVVFDLSADFRLGDRPTYEQWYGDHGAPERFGTAAYGLVELHRDELRDADLVAVPGCYPTSAALALAPLLKARLVEPSGLVVDSKSGASGMGRSPSPTGHLPEAAEGVRAYKVAQHRHTRPFRAVVGRELQRLEGWYVLGPDERDDGDQPSLHASVSEAIPTRPFLRIVRSSNSRGALLLSATSSGKAATRIR